jgi:hypothetical protein
MIRSKLFALALTLAGSLCSFSAAHADDARPAPQQQPAQTRKFSFNGRAATAQDLQTLAQIERMYGKQTPEGAYWYDARSGAAGQWGGPTAASCTRSMSRC